jgi:hypothetical protein
MLRTRKAARRACIVPSLWLAFAVAATPAARAADAINEIIAPLGEPRRNVVPQARSAQMVGQQLAIRDPAASGVFPVMIFPSNALVVENVYGTVPPSKCRSVLATYDRRLRAKYGDKIRHGLYCVSVSNGKLISIDTVAKSF